MNSLRQKWSTRLTVTVILTFLGLTLFFPPNAGDRVVHAAGSGPIYIGQTVHLTGPLSREPGVFERQGTKLAVSEINAHGGIRGRPLTLVTADDRSTPEGGIAAFEQLSESHHIVAVIGPDGGPEVPAIAPFLERARIPMIIGPAVIQPENPWLVRTRPSLAYRARALTSFAVGTLHLSRIAVMQESGTTTDIVDDLKGLGITPVTIQSYLPFSADLTAQVVAIKKSGATGMILSGSAPADFRLLALQMKQAGVHLTLLGNPTVIATSVLPGGDMLWGMYGVTDFIATQSPEALKLDRAVRARFHVPANFAHGYTYDGVKILARVIRAVGTDPGAIRRGILALRNYHGAEGTYTFDQHGDGLRQYTVVHNIHGHLRLIKVLSF